MDFRKINKLTSLVLTLGLALSIMVPAGIVHAATNAADFTNTGASTDSAVRRGTTNKMVLNIVLSNSGATTLDAITFTNTGTAIEAASGNTDIMPNGVKVYLDGGNNTFEPAGDTLVGAATRTANQAWALDTAQALAGANARIYVTVDVAQTATDGRTFIFRIPQTVDGNANGAFNTGDAGVFYASADDGPADADITSATTQTIQVSSVDIDTNAPSAPTNLTVSAGSDHTSLNLSWTGVSGAYGYRIYRAMNTDNAGQMIDANVGGTSYVDTGLMPGTTYYYLVQTVGSNGVISANLTQTAGTTSMSTPAPTTPAPTTPAPTTPTTPTTPAPTTPAPTTPPVVVNPASFDYQAAWVSQSGTVTADGKAHEVKGAAGSSVQVTLTLKNTGKAWWYGTTADGAHEVKLGTYNPADHISALEHGTWLSANRIVKLNSMVKNGENYTFTFTVNIPQGASGTSTDLYVRPVAEWVKWFGPTGIFWRVTVA